MSAHFLSYLRFHAVRVIRAQPIPVALCGIALAGVVIAGSMLIAQAQRLDAARQSLSELRARTAAGASSQADTAVTSAPLDLPPFQSATMVSSIHEIATESGLTLDEVSYALDDNSTRPYLRYRFTMTVTAAYPLVRRFLDQLHTRVPHLALDAIDCSREDIVVTALSCELVMSGLFEKRRHG